ncbi:MAG: hypothetical protein GEV05_20050 [Betaproteobacteria bacterium]|nr:hypothetical protein [Betaproteobacteria bacterium]
MKIYQVLQRDGMWHVHIPDVSAGVYPSEDKSYMVEWACDAARRCDGEVHVRDRGGQIEAVYGYVNGVQQRKACSGKR